MRHKPHWLKPISKKIVPCVRQILLFLFYSYVKSHLDNHIWIPIYKTIPEICNTLRQTQCVRNSIFPHFVVVITCCGPSYGLWLCVGALNRGRAKNIENYFHVGIIAVEISRAGPTTTVFVFLYS
jgi:hypothetical protein